MLFIKQHTPDFKVVNKINYFCRIYKVGKVIKHLFHGFLGEQSISCLPGKGRSSRKQFPRASPLTEGQQFDCSPKSHGINVYYSLTYYIKCNLLFLSVSLILLLISCIMHIKQSHLACFKHLGVFKRIGDQDVAYQTTLTCI